MKITSFTAREVLDSRGNPTVEVEINGQKAIAPSGASTGAHEAVELRDGGSRYHGKGTTKAVSQAASMLKKAEERVFETQASYDSFLLKQDSTKNKRRLGANTLVACSTAFFKALAFQRHTPTWAFFKKPRKIPVPIANVINGGAHAQNGLSIQEFMIIPEGLKTTSGRVRAVSEIYHQLKTDLQKHGLGVGVGDEGGFAPPLRSTHDALDFIAKAVRECGYEKQVSLGLDCAATQFYKDNHYYLDGAKHHADALADHYVRLQKTFRIAYFEDPFYEEDFNSFAAFTKKIRGTALVVGDDLTVTNTKRIKVAIEKKACSGVILKPNQAGTITETLEAFVAARNAKWAVVVSHRSGETEDAFIADFACALEADFAKIGAPCRGERTSKYNQLLRIAEQVE
ncbi:MAG: enolase [Candidatus Norongarragalinales archaeon]